ncbi:MAG: protein kinase [Polyangia bacterium]
MRPEEWIGRILARTYLIEELLGSGGMGAVYRARQLRTGGLVAVKVLKPEAASEVEILRRFRTEAQVIAGLRHPHIVQVIDFHEEGGSAAPFLVMDLLEGEDLHTRLRKTGRLSYEAACKLIMEVASALQAAHNRDIVHRDIKPQNLFIHRQASVSGDDEIYKVVDFGISKIQSVSRRTPTLTVIGTPHYMAPEATLPKSDAIDGRTDQFSLGVVLYRALSGRAPFDGPDSLGVLYQVIHSEPEPLEQIVSDVPAHAIRAIERSMRKDKAARFPSVVEFAHAFVGLPRSSRTDWKPVPALQPVSAETVRLVRTAVPLQPAAPTHLSLASLHLEVDVEPARLTPNSLSSSTGQTNPKPASAGVSLARVSIPLVAVAVCGIAAWLIVSSSQKVSLQPAISSPPVLPPQPLVIPLAPPERGPAVARKEESRALAATSVSGSSASGEAGARAPVPVHKAPVSRLPARRDPAPPEPREAVALGAPPSEAEAGEAGPREQAPEPAESVSPGAADPAAADQPTPPRKHLGDECRVPQLISFSPPETALIKSLQGVLRKERICLWTGQSLTFYRNQLDRARFVVPAHIPTQLREDQIKAVLDWLHKPGHVPGGVRQIRVDGLRSSASSAPSP